MAIRYGKVDGEWLFESRRERHWYANDLVDLPQCAAFNGWLDTAPNPDLPRADSTWSSFWAGHDTTELTRQP